MYNERGWGWTNFSILSTEREMADEIGFDDVISELVLGKREIFL